MSTEICRLGVGHNLNPLKCRLSVEKNFPPKTTKMLFWHVIDVIFSVLVFRIRMFLNKSWIIRDLKPRFRPLKYCIFILFMLIASTTHSAYRLLSVKSQLCVCYLYNLDILQCVIQNSTMLCTRQITLYFIILELIPLVSEVRVCTKVILIGQLSSKPG